MALPSRKLAKSQAVMSKVRPLIEELLEWRLPICVYIYTYIYIYICMSRIALKLDLSA